MIFRFVLIAVAGVSIAVAGLALWGFDHQRRQDADHAAYDLMTFNTILSYPSGAQRSPHDAKAEARNLLMLSLLNVLTIYPDMTEQGKAVLRKKLQKTLDIDGLFDFPGGHPMQVAYQRAEDCLRAHPDDRTCAPLMDKAFHAGSLPDLDTSFRDQAAQAPAGGAGSGMAPAPTRPN